MVLSFESCLVKQNVLLVMYAVEVQVDQLGDQGLVLKYASDIVTRLRAVKMRCF